MAASPSLLEPSAARFGPTGNPLDSLNRHQLPNATASATADFSAFAEALDRAARPRPRSDLPGGSLLLCRAMVNRASRIIRVCCTKRIEYWNQCPPILDR